MTPSMQDEEWARLANVQETVTVKTRQGLLTVLTNDNAISKCLYVNKAHQYNEAKAVLSFLRGEDRLPPRGEGTVVDAGAHVGEISIGMLLDGEFRRAIAAEPSPRHFKLLKRNVVQNGLAGRFGIHECALSDMDGEEDLELCISNAGDNRVRRGSDEPAIAGETSRPTVKVKARTLDSLMPDPRGVALVWMDIQGFDGYVFKGGENVFSQDIPVNVEVWPYGIKRAGMALDEYVGIVEGLWSTFCVNKTGRYVERPISEFMDLARELEDGAGNVRFRDVILLK